MKNEVGAPGAGGEHRPVEDLIDGNRRTTSSALVRLKQDKVFVIGWHRTGTRSINQALGTLGLRTIHWWPGWLDQRDVVRPRILGRYDAFSDFPFPLLFAQLDDWYPDGRFILTTRSAEAWLRSVQKHFDEAHWRHEDLGIRVRRALRRITHPGYLSRDGRRVESERMFEIAYGRVTFDRETFLERYLRHNREVRDHFAACCSRLLVMDLERNCGWEDLCGFLGVPKPQQPYPRVSGDHG